MSLWSPPWTCLSRVFLPHRNPGHRGGCRGSSPQVEWRAPAPAELAGGSARGLACALALGVDVSAVLSSGDYRAAQKPLHYLPPRGAAHRKARARHPFGHERLPLIGARPTSRP